MKTKRYVYGSRSKKWHLVDSSDRDYKHGFTKSDMKRLGKKKAKEKWNSGSFIR